MEVQGEPVVQEGDDAFEEIWVTKFKRWKMMKNSCISQTGPSGIYCLWVGQNCSYKSCPRRIFEEVTIDITKIPTPPAVPKLKKRVQQQAQAIKQLQNKNTEQQKVINTLTNRLTELEKIVA